MVAITSMNLIDVQAIVSNIMAVESLRGDRLVAQKSTQSAQIVALQELNTSMAAVGTAAQAITSAARWVPPTTAVAFSDSGDAGKVSAYSSAGAVSGASPYPFSVTSIVGGGSATATISYTKDSATVTQTSSSNTFSGLADFPGLTITVSGVTAGTATVTPSATTSSTSTVMTTAAQNLVTALNTTLNLIKVQTAADGVLETSYTPREVSQNLLSTAFDSNTLASLADTGINLTRYGSFIFDSSILSTAYDNRASTPASLDTIGQVAAFAARVDAVATAATSVTGSLSREVSTRQSRVSDLTQQILDMNTALTQRENSLTVFYSELNAKISSLQSQQSYLQTTLDVFVKALTKS
ncbi:flagellar filament capping protein FliD [Candidatus Nanopelagicales bacterium]|nr:flagellar filament capping protein FliD [Candidatus Nanopelagicales bacterium]